MPQVLRLIVLDEFSFELEAVEVRATRRALAQVEDLVLVQDVNSEYFVTYHQGKVTLWNPEAHWADQRSCKASGDLEAALSQAETWLSTYLGGTDGLVETVIDLQQFSAQE
ncbi:hypothetical protein D3C72_425570 [compost metagenome]